MIPTPESASRLPGEADANRSVLGALRIATAQRHELLHEIMPLSVKSVALRDYLAHLAILRAWLAPIERWFEGFSDGPQSSALAARMNRLALIDADLAHVSIQAGDAVSMPSMADDQRWNGAQSAAYRWGVCYVIEGSQLGGAVLYARLKDGLAPHPLGFLNAGREALGARWQAFIRAMSADVHSPAMIDEACRGAADAFDRLIELARASARACCANVD